MIIVTRQRNKMWNDRMAYTITDNGSIAFTEQMENPETGEVVDGRTISIDSYTVFAQLIGVSDDRQLDTVMNDKASRGLLYVDYLHRFAELHSLTYSITGDRMFAAYRKYCEQARQEKSDKESYYKDMGWEGRELLYGSFGGFGKDQEKGLKLLHEAMENGDMNARNTLTGYYADNEQWGKAARYALDGAMRGDLVSMAYLSRLYEKGADFENFTDNLGDPDLASAIEWCIKSVEGGNHREISQLNYYIHKGYLDPDSKRYVKILKVQAQRTKEILEYLKAHPFVDPQLTEARRAMESGEPDGFDKAVKILKDAIADGNVRLYRDLAEFYMGKSMLGLAAQTAMQGLDTGYKPCLWVLARLCAKGADLVGFSDNVSEPDERELIKWYVRIVEEIPSLPIPAIQKLDMYIKDGKLDFDRLSETVKEKINHYNRYKAEKASGQYKRKKDFLYGDK